MRMSDEKNNIIQSLIKVQSELAPIKKDRENPYASSKYATLDAILAEILPILNGNGIFMTQEPKTKEKEGNDSVYIGVTTTFFHSSGEFIEYDPLWFLLEKGAKMNMAQSSGSIITYIKRYSISAVLGISTDEDKDGIVNNTQVQENNRNYQQQNQQQSNDNHDVLNKIKEYRELLAKDGKLSDTNIWILKNDGVQDLTEIPHVRLMALYKTAVMKLQNNRQTELEGTGPVKWGQG